MKEDGLKLAQEKSEAVLVTKRRKFEYPKLVLDGHMIQFQDSIRYLGLWIDRHWNFKDHIRRTSTKAGNVGTALQQLMPNVGGPKQGCRALLATVVNSVLLYGLLLWGAHAHSSVVIKNMAPVQRRIALRVISGYRSISLGATLLFAGMAPIWLRAKERANVWERQQREDDTATLLDIKTEAQAVLLQEWQGEWSAYPKGRWTHTFIRNVKECTTRDHGKLDYWVTQTLSGHGCFGAYLF